MMDLQGKMSHLWLSDKLKGERFMQTTMTQKKVYDVMPGFSKPTERITYLKQAILNSTPKIEVERARLITESYKQTEDLPSVLRHALGFANILQGLPVVIRDKELIVGTATKGSRSTQVFPEFGTQGLDEEFETVSTRFADPYEIEPEVVEEFKDIFAYWKGRSTSERALALMDEPTLKAYQTGLFTVGNYQQGGIGHLAVDYEKVLVKGIKGIIADVHQAMAEADRKAPDWLEKEQFYKAALITLEAVVVLANRYADEAKRLASQETDPIRQQELNKIAEICAKVPEHPATTFYEAMQSFWFVQLAIQIESSGHSISPGRFDQYMYPFYNQDEDITQAEAQELLDCLFVKFNDLNKLRDQTTARAFSGYQLWQNINCGGQTKEGLDATNAISYMEIDAQAHVMMSMPSISIRVWNGTPDEFLLKACELSRLGGGQPAFYNDEVLVPAKVNRGETLEDARNYAVIGCVEPASQGKENSWCDAALFNMPKVLEMAMNNGRLNGEDFGPHTGEFEDFQTFEAFFNAYQAQMAFGVGLLVRADNAVDVAHRELAPVAFASTLIDDCIGKGKSLMHGGAHYNFTGPQGIGAANIGNALMAVKQLVFDEQQLTMAELKEAMDNNWGMEVLNPVELDVNGTMSLTDNAPVREAQPIQTKEAEKYRQIHQQVMNVAKFGNDQDDVDYLTRIGTRVYCEELETYETPRGGIFNAGLYPVSGNVLFGSYIGATPDGRFAHETIADGVSPTRGTDTLGPTAAANSVAKLDHFIASNGTLYNMKFSPSAVAGPEGLRHFASLIRTYFDRKGAHVQFNVVDKQVLIDAQKHPEQHKDLIVRVAGYSSQFISLAKSIQDDLIARTEFETV